jgi:subtilisin family serine protease
MTLRERIGIATAVGVGLSLALICRAEVNPAFSDSLLIVELMPGGDIEEINADYGTVTVAAIADRDLYLQALPQVLSMQSAGQSLADDPRVRETESDDDCLAPEAVNGDTQPIFFFVPPDEFDEQLSAGQLNLDAVHEWATGADTVIALLDTGVDPDHELLAGRIEPGGYNFVDGNNDTADVGSGLDRDGDGLVDEMVGHGTFVAGLLATIAPDATILPIRVLDPEGFSDAFRLVQGIYHAVDQGVDVIHLGLGTRSHNQIIRDAVDAAHAAGIVVVAAAGNDDHEHPVQMPAGQDTTIGVTSTDLDDIKSDFSNYGQYISLSAPGRDIVSAMPGGLYARASGTSVSSALVAGTVALLRSQEPLATPDEIEDRLTSHAANIDGVNPGYVGLLGAGRLDPAAALDPTLVVDDLVGLPSRRDDRRPAIATSEDSVVRVLADLLIVLGEDGKTHDLLYSHQPD